MQSKLTKVIFIHIDLQICRNMSDALNHCTTAARKTKYRHTTGKDTSLIIITAYAIVSLIIVETSLVMTALEPRIYKLLFSSDEGGGGGLRHITSRVTLLFSFKRDIMLTLEK